MQINSIQLKNFRGYYSLKLNFLTGLNVFIGKNASGKSNLLEAIHYLSYAKSFRSVDDKELINNNSEYSTITAEIEQNQIKTNIHIYISNLGKKILINKKSINKLSDLCAITNVIIFSPNDVNIFKDSPKIRRSYLDINISKLNPVYIELLKNVDNLIKERNEILKMDKINFTQLDIITSSLIKEEKEIVLMRQNFIDKINDVIQKIAYEIKGVKEEVKLVYFPYIKINDSYTEDASNLYKNNLENDIKHKATGIGIHREDFILNLNNKNIAISGSQGENRLIAIALKLSPYFLVDDKNKHPIVCLDDVLSELDFTNQKRLINFLRKLNQVFITSTNFNIEKTNIYQIKNHQIIRRKQ